MSSRQTNDVPRAVRLRLAVESGCDVTAVERFLRGERVREATRRLVTEAAARLRIALPPAA